MSQPQAPPEIQSFALETLGTDIVFLLLGLYGWEYVQSLRIEYDVLCGRSSFRAPLIPYIVGRLALFCYLILHVIQSSPYPSSPSMCDPGQIFMSLLATIALACASMIFMIRTWLIWKDHRLVHALLVPLVLGQWILLLFAAATSEPKFVDGVCDVTIKHPNISSASLIYTMCLDFLVFVLSVVGLARERSVSPLKQRLLKQGVLYFAIAGIAYIPMTVIVTLKTEDEPLLLNIFISIGFTASTIAASRSVRSLLSLKVCSPSGTEDSDVAPMTSRIAIGTLTSSHV